MESKKMFLSGVQGGNKPNRKLDDFIYDKASVAKSLKPIYYRKPVCSIEVIVRLSISIQPKTAMEVWKFVRHLFPYYQKCPVFTLRYVRQIISSISDAICVNEGNADKNRASLNHKFSLRDDVSFSYEVQDIIGENESMENFTSNKGKLCQLLKRSAVTIQKKMLLGKMDKLLLEQQENTSPTLQQIDNEGCIQTYNDILKPLNQETFCKMDLSIHKTISSEELGKTLCICPEKTDGQRVPEKSRMKLNSNSTSRYPISKSNNYQKEIIFLERPHYPKMSTEYSEKILKNYEGFETTQKSEKQESGEGKKKSGKQESGERKENLETSETIPQKYFITFGNEIEETLGEHSEQNSVKRKPVAGEEKEKPKAGEEKEKPGTSEEIAMRWNKINETSVNFKQKSVKNKQDLGNRERKLDLKVKKYKKLSDKSQKRKEKSQNLKLSSRQKTVSKINRANEMVKTLFKRPTDEKHKHKRPNVNVANKTKISERPKILSKTKSSDNLSSHIPAIFPANIPENVPSIILPNIPANTELDAGSTITVNYESSSLVRHCVPSIFDDDCHNLREVINIDNPVMRNFNVGIDLLGCETITYENILPLFENRINIDKVFRTNPDESVFNSYSKMESNLISDTLSGGNENISCYAGEFAESGNIFREENKIEFKSENKSIVEGNCGVEAGNISEEDDEVEIIDIEKNTKNIVCVQLEEDEGDDVIEIIKKEMERVKNSDVVVSENILNEESIPKIEKNNKTVVENRCAVKSENICNAIKNNVIENKNNFESDCNTIVEILSDENDCNVENEDKIKSSGIMGSNNDNDSFEIQNKNKSCNVDLSDNDSDVNQMETRSEFCETINSKKGNKRNSSFSKSHNRKKFKKSCNTKDFTESPIISSSEGICEDIVSSSTYLSENVQENLSRVSGDECDSTSNPTIYEEFVQNERFKKYSWVTFDKESTVTNCNACNKTIATYSDKPIEELMELLHHHSKSNQHILARIIQYPKLIEEICFVIKFDLQNVLSQGDLMELFRSIAKNYIDDLIADEILIQLLHTLNEFVKTNILSTLRDSNLPFSLILDFCKKISIVRYVTEDLKPIECVLPIINLKYRNLAEFLNSVQLSPQRLVFYNAKASCNRCRDCKAKISLPTDNNTLPPRLPKIRELLSFIKKDPYIYPYYRYVLLLSELYNKYPQRFICLPEASILRKPAFLKHYEFIKKNYCLLQNICLDIHRTHGDIEALGLSQLKMEFNETSSKTINLINDTCRRVTSLYKSLNCLGTHSEMETKRLHLKVHTDTIILKAHNCQQNIEEYLINFLRELLSNVYIYDTQNIEELKLPLNFGQLGNLFIFPQVRDIIYKIFLMFKLFVGLTDKAFMEELQSFGIFMLRTHKVNHYSLIEVLNVFHLEPSIKVKYPGSFRFYTALATLPVFPAVVERSAYITWNKFILFSNKFGQKLAENLLIPHIEGLPDKELSNLSNFIRVRLVDPP